MRFTPKWGEPPPSLPVSKGGSEAGYFDLFIGGMQENTWTVQVVDDANRPISPSAEVILKPGESCSYVVNFKQ